MWFATAWVNLLEERRLRERLVHISVCVSKCFFFIFGLLLLKRVFHQLEFAGPEMLQCSGVVGKCKDSVCLDNTELALLNSGCYSSLFVFPSWLALGPETVHLRNLRGKWPRWWSPNCTKSKLIESARSLTPYLITNCSTAGKCHLVLVLILLLKNVIFPLNGSCFTVL